MATKESEVAFTEHSTYQNADGTNGHGLGRQISVTLTPQQFEELYLQPSVKSRGQMSLVKTFGNPTALGIVSFLLTFAPTSCCLMGWRGASSNSLLALIGAYYFMGGMALYVAGLLEFVIGNTFPALVFTSFGTFWFTLGGFLDPHFAVQTTLLTAEGGSAAQYYTPFAFYLIFWAVYTFFLTFAAFRTNVVLVWILLFVALAFSTLGAAYFSFGEGSLSTGANLVTAAGACGFTACMGGFYILLHLCLAATDFPFNIPLFDLAHLWGNKQ
ncbi:related to ATO3 - plasma membrane protein with possible role in export of ammonia [Melanopsichium pennsylvanicum]|uniref:Related to ATO3 - plasma membrane protein with possible role in export of ammonia n=2 Tax=Melanopsichium pennsylvanicum TaxID=63383 RepID=A0AAJ5C5N2_9BASI|nr:gpr1 fun34-class plasma membrane protein [Melanopsichium pennsylvanicum 4]SNX84916.1 related to ATO3 - plasma membrane protein with possible role in export of ammonia [Melanopsichium pennsylvanicum]